MSDEKQQILRLLLVDFGQGWAGGQTQSSALARGMAARGHEVTFVCQPESELAKNLQGAPLQLVEISAKSRRDVGAIIRLARLMREIGPDIVHNHESLSFWIGGIAAKASRVQPKIVVHKRTDHRPGALAAFRYNHMADAIIAISQAAQQGLIEAGVEKDKIEKIYSSVDCSHFAPDASLSAEFRRNLGGDERSPLIGAIGTLAPRKGHRFLLQAMPRILEHVKDVMLVICGSGALQSELQEEARRLQIDNRIVFLGESDDVRHLLAALDILVMPSLAEGLGVAVLEAMAMGRPVVASYAGGLLELVEQEQTGLLVAPGDSEALAAAIVRLLEDADMRAAFGKSARRRAQEIFGREAMIEHTEELYLGLLHEKEETG